MDDYESISQLMGLEGDGEPIDYGANGNPFSSHPSEKSSASTNLKHNPNLTLLQRVNKMHPHMPPCVTRATRLTQSAKLTTSNLQSFQSPNVFSRVESREAPVGHHRKQLMSEFINEKREIYLYQLFIDFKRKEIQRFYREQVTQERLATEREKEIQEETEALKSSTNQLESNLARMKSRAERAAQERSRLQKALKTVGQDISLLKSDISKNEDMLEAQRPYLYFLELFVPIGMSVLEYYRNDPKILLENLEKIEYENLFIIQQYQRMEEFLNNKKNIFDKSFKDTLVQHHEVLMSLENLETVEEFPKSFSKTQQKEINDNESELHRLNVYVTQTYESCYKEAADITPIAMLERIENSMERMANQCSLVTPEFLEMKKQAKEEARRLQMRLEKQEKSKRDQQAKIMMTIERAKKPIPRRTGRPINGRILPIHAKKIDEKVILKKLAEQQMEEKLLFGNSD